LSLDFEQIGYFALTLLVNAAVLFGKILMVGWAISMVCVMLKLVWLGLQKTVDVLLALIRSSVLGGTATERLARMAGNPRRQSRKTSARRWDVTGRAGEGADLSGLRAVESSRARLLLWCTKLEGTNLRRADLRGVDLAGRNLEYADLREANLEGIDLRGTRLWGADLSMANLRGTNMEGVNLFGVKLAGADLEGANLTDARIHDRRSVELGGAHQLDRWGRRLPLRDRGERPKRLHIKNLRDLEGIATRDVFVGDLEFDGPEGLSQIDLPRLESVTGSLAFTIPLNSITMPRLKSVGSFHLDAPVTAINLPSLQTVYETVYIRSHAGLKTLAGLSKLEYSGCLYLHENEALESLSGLSRLTFVGSLHIRENKGLHAIDFPCLQSVGEGIDIQGNDLLPQVEAEVFASSIEVGGTRKTYPRSRLARWLFGQDRAVIENNGRARADPD